MLEVLTDSQSLKKNFLARRWGPEKASPIIIIARLARPWYMDGAQVCKVGEGAICFVTKPWWPVEATPCNLIIENELNLCICNCAFEYWASKTPGVCVVANVEYAACNQLGNVYLSQEKLSEVLRSYQIVVKLRYGLLIAGGFSISQHVVVSDFMLLNWLFRII